MSKNRRHSVKRENIQIQPEALKYRTLSKLYPLSRPQIKEKLLEYKSITNKKDKKLEFYNLDEEFLFALIQPIFLLDKQKMHNTITRLIFNSKLITKLEGDLEKKESLNSSMNDFIKNLIYRRFERDEILYHTGEIDNKFYFVIKGRISELKPKRIEMEMSLDDYILYLIDLKNRQEIVLLNRIIKLNSNVVPIKSIEDIKKVNTIIFKKKLETLITSEEPDNISDNNELELFFKEYFQNFETYNMSKKKLKKLIINRGKIILGVLNTEWDDYVLEHCKLTSDENLFFESFEALFKINKYKFLCYKFEYNEEYIDNDYFGDFSLDEDRVTRNETVRFEEDTTIALINMDEYVDVISPQKKIEKKNDIMRLNTSFCFKEISERIFKRNYYDMFIKKQYSRNTLVFNSGSEANSLIFIKKGKLSLQLNCSLIELNNLIKLIYQKLTNVSGPDESYQKKILSKGYLNELEYLYLNDPSFINMRAHDNAFKIELEKKRNFQIAVFSDSEMLGLEEIYLKIPHFAKAVVAAEKLYFNELNVKKFNVILHNEMGLIKESYIQVSINRILSLLERLHNIKQNYVNMAKLRTNADSSNIQTIPKKLNVEYHFNISNRKLNINNNKTSIPQINLATKNIDNNKNEENDVKVLFKKNKINSSKRKSYTKKTHFVKSAKKMRNKSLILELDVNNKERAKSGKFNDLNKIIEEDEDEENKKKKKKISNIILIGNRKVNIKNLRRELNELKLIKDIDENKDNAKNTIDDINKTQTNIIEKNNYNKIENKKIIIINKEKMNEIKSQILKKEKLSIKIPENENFTKSNNNNYSILDMSIINNYSSRINKMFPLPFIPTNPNLFKNKKLTYLNLLTQNNIKEKNAKIIQTIPSNSENENSKLNVLPKIEQNNKLNRYLNISSNSNRSNSISNRNKYNGKIPDIVKNFYLEKKQKGCIPLIVNKRSNTLFLRKYHKKYNDN